MHARGTAALLPEAGLELFGLREVPLVDRERERDQLWEDLRSVGRTDAPALVVLEGGPGTGKSRLARWLARRAHELGAATITKGFHGPASDPDEGLRGMVRRSFRTSGLERGEVFERLADRLPPIDDGNSLQTADARGLTELLRPTSDDTEPADGPSYRFSRPSQKYALLVRLVRRLASRRRLVVWFDDLHWGRATTEFLQYLFSEAEDPGPVLVVATVRRDIVAEEHSVRAGLRRLYDAAGARRVHLEPLGRDDHRDLIDHLLHLDADLARRLARRTEGHPLFAVQLLRDWIDRDVLEPAPEGFRLSEDAEVELPDDIHRLWLERLRRLAESTSETGTERVWEALEWAAILGREVDALEWKEVCAETGVRSPNEVRDDLLERGLAERTDAGWAYAHALAVESIERRAREHGRWRRHHRRSARLLDGLDAPHGAVTAQRRADHWIAADEHERALEPLWRESQRLQARGAFDRARDVLERRAGILDRLELAEDDPRRIENEIDLAAFALRSDGSPAEVLESLHDVRSRAENRAIPELIAAALRQIGRCFRRMGKPERARSFGRRAVEKARESDDSTELVGALISAAWSDYWGGALESAEARFREARQRSATIDDRYRRAVAHRGLALVELSRGERDRAGARFEEVLEESREAGFRRLEASAVNGLGELARFGGDAERARNWYRHFRDLCRELVFPDGGATVEINFAQVELLDERPELAARHLDEAERKLERIGQQNERIHLLRVGRLTRAAQVEDWEEFDRILARYDDGWPEGARKINDHPWLLEIAGDAARAAGESERARGVWRLAVDLWRELDDQEAADQIEAKLADL